MKQILTIFFYSIAAALQAQYLHVTAFGGFSFYQGRKNYSLHQFALPFGTGIKFAFSENVRLAIEIGMRKTNTDFLDDVSTTYLPEVHKAAVQKAKTGIIFRYQLLCTFT